MCEWVKRLKCLRMYLLQFLQPLKAQSDLVCSQSRPVITRFPKGPAGSSGCQDFGLDAGKLCAAT